VLIKLAQAMKQCRQGEGSAAAAGRLAQAPSERAAGRDVPAETTWRNKQYKPAIALLEGIVKQNPTILSALNNLAWAYQQEKDPRALATAEQALKSAATARP
jgi:tetratricopeptide (TPR) repeat protein